MIKLWFITACHERFALTRLCLEQRSRMLIELQEAGIDAHCIVAADDANLDAAAQFGLDTMRRQNYPLGWKVNEMFAYACQEGEADYVVTIGSDDWCLASQFAHLPEPDTVKMSGHAALVHPSGSKIMLVRCLSNEVGIIPWIIPRALLEPVDFRPADSEARQYIDGSIRRGLGAKALWSVEPVDELQLVDFKSDTNITSYDIIHQVREDVREMESPFTLLATRYPSDLCESAANLYLRAGWLPNN